MSKIKTGTIGLYKGIKSEIKTTRAFRLGINDKNVKTRIRGVELFLLDKVDKEYIKTNFPTYGRSCGAGGDVFTYYDYVFIDIKDFRKNFVYSDVITMLYNKNE